MWTYFATELREAARNSFDVGCPVKVSEINNSGGSSNIFLEFDFLFLFFADFYGMLFICL